MSPASDRLQASFLNREWSWLRFNERVLEEAENLQFADPALRDKLAKALRERLSRDGIEIPVAVGMCNWEPYVADAMRELSRDGARRVLPAEELVPGLLDPEGDVLLRSRIGGPDLELLADLRLPRGQLRRRLHPRDRRPPAPRRCWNSSARPTISGPLPGRPPPG